MKEIFDIISAQHAAVAAGKQTVLATVVKVEGSSYRKEGARMLICEDGQLTGAISGGCLEGDAMRKALLVMAEQKPVVLTYDSMDEEDAKFGVQLGCNGIVHILLEPVLDSDPRNPVTLLQQACSRRESAVLATLFSLTDRHAPHPGTCVLLRKDDAIVHDQLERELADSILLEAHSALQLHQQFLTMKGEWQVLIDVVEPPVSLILFGAGNDAMPLVQMGAVLGWRITIVDGRPGRATSQRFPAAAAVLVAKPEEAMAQLRFDARTVALLMTHNYNYELAMLPSLLHQLIPYIGLLGPRRKKQRMLDDLHEGGIQFSMAELECLHGPTGLDIGAQTAEEIALSILADIQMVLSNTNGAALRDKQDSIHTGLQIHTVKALS